MEIYQLNGLDYHINEKEAFDKSVFNAAEYNVTLAVPEGTNLNAYINEGDQIAGNYTVNGLTTNFESLVQDISITRQFQAGYDMYNLKLSENILNVARKSILDVPDGGTGAEALNGVLKGNGLSPVSQAVDGVDYWSPETIKPVTINDGWLVEHLGGSHYRLHKIINFGKVPINNSTPVSNLFISAAVRYPNIPSEFTKNSMEFSICDSINVNSPWWLFNLRDQIRIASYAQQLEANLVLAVTAYAQKLDN